MQCSIIKALPSEKLFYTANTRFFLFLQPKISLLILVLFTLYNFFILCQRIFKGKSKVNFSLDGKQMQKKLAIIQDEVKTVTCGQSCEVQPRWLQSYRGVLKYPHFVSFSIHDAKRVNFLSTALTSLKLRENLKKVYGKDTAMWFDVVLPSPRKNTWLQ